MHPTNGSTTQLTVDGKHQSAPRNELMGLVILVLLHIAAPPGSKGPQRQNFSFDKVIGPEDGQYSVYESIEP